MSVLTSDGGDTMSSFPLHQGRSQVLAAPERITTLLLWKDGEEVRRIPLALEPGEVNVIRG